MKSHQIPFRWLSWYGLALALLAPAAQAVEPARAEALVEQAARGWLTAQADERGLAEPVFELKAMPRRPQPPLPCAQAPVVDALDTASVLRLRFMLVCPGPDGWQQEWTVRAAVSAMVVVARRDVPANQPLVDDDLAVERRRLTDLASAVTLPEDALGQSSSRTLRAGQPVLARTLSPPMLLRRGDSVTILARNAGIEVRAAGEALEPGRRQQIVRVRNTSTGKVIRARVLDSGLVEPESIMGSSER